MSLRSKLYKAIQVKECISCKETKEIDNFYKSGGLPHSYCKKCHSKIANGIARQKRQDASAEVVEEILKKGRIATKRYRAKYPLKKKEEGKKYRKHKGEHCAAHTKLNYAITAGKIERGKCRDCDRTDTHGHHPNYKEPLKVVWLCPVHHNKEHKKL